MKRFAKSLLVIGSIAAAGTASADWFEGFAPYLGVDAKWQNTQGKSDWKKVIPKNYWGGTVYVGSRFDNCWGLEFGFTETQRKSKTHSFAAGENFFGNGDTGGAVTRVRNRFHNWHLDVNGYWPVDDCWELIGSIGFGWMKPKVSVAVNNLGNGATGFFPLDGAALATTHGKARGVFRVGAGAQYMATDCLGLRAIARWENTSTLRVDGNYGNRDPNSTINYSALKKMFKDTYSVAFGAFWKF